MVDSDSIDLLFARELEQQRARYRNNLPEKLNQIEQMWGELDSVDWPVSEIGQLHRLIHNLAGSGGTFGLPQVSLAARPLERRLRTAVRSETHPPLPERSELRLMYEQLVSTVREVTGASGTQRQKPKPQVVASADFNQVGARLAMTHAPRCIYLFGEASVGLEGTLRRLEFEVKLLNDRKSLAEVLASGHGVVVMDIEWAMSRFPQPRSMPEVISSVQIVYTSRHDNFANRLAAVRRNGSGFLSQPVDVANLLECVGKLGGVKNARILLVDDDQAFSEYFKHALGATGLELLHISTVREVMSTVVEFAPDLVLLDVNMPEASGFEIAQMLRQHPANRNLPLLFLTGGDPSLEKRLDLLANGADQYLSKDLPPDLMRRSLDIWLQRARERVQSTRRDGLTGLPNQAAYLDVLSRELARARRYGQRLSVALFDVVELRCLNEAHGYGLGDRLLVTLARFMKQSLRPSETLARFGGGAFGLILPDTAPILSVSIVDRLRSSIERGAEIDDISYSLSVGISSYPRYESPAELITAAKEALKTAKTRSGQIYVAGDRPS